MQPFIWLHFHEEKHDFFLECCMFPSFYKIEGLSYFYFNVIN
jgi:hypothetical protein